MTIITTTQAAGILGCSAYTVSRLCAEGEIRAQKHNGSWAIDEVDCREYARTYVNNKKPWRTVDGVNHGRSISISPSSKSRTRKRGHVGLALAMQKIRERRPELARER